MKTITVTDIMAHNIELMRTDKDLFLTEKNAIAEALCILWDRMDELKREGFTEDDIMNIHRLISNYNHYVNIMRNSGAEENELPK